MVQPPNEDRVSVFTSLPGGKQASIKLFSTGKIRCLKSDFKSLVREPRQKSTLGVCGSRESIFQWNAPACSTTLPGMQCHARARHTTLKSLSVLLTL
jgi:hypothetical protein